MPHSAAASIVRCAYARFSASCPGWMMLRRCRCTDGIPMPCDRATAKNSSRRDGSRSAGRTWLSASSASENPAAAIWPKTSSHTAGSASWKATPSRPTGANPCRHTAIGQVSAVQVVVSQSCWTQSCGVLTGCSFACGGSAVNLFPIGKILRRCESASDLTKPPARGLRRRPGSEDQDARAADPNLGTGVPPFKTTRPLRTLRTTLASATVRACGTRPPATARGRRRCASASPRRPSADRPPARPRSPGARARHGRCRRRRPRRSAASGAPAS